VYKQFFTYLLLLLCYAAPAQVGWENPVLEIDERDGLPDTYYKDFEEDEFGFIWVLTYKGVCRYDGTLLECLEHELLPEQGYSAIEYDSARKRLWITSSMGLFSYDIISQEVVKYKHALRIGIEQILALKLDAKGRIWIGTRTHLACLEEGRDSLVNVEIKVDHAYFTQAAFNEIHAIACDPVDAQKLWLVTDGGVIKYLIDRDEFFYASDEIGNPDNLIINEIYVSPSSQRIYFGVKKQRVRKKTKNYFIYDARQNKPFGSLYIDENWDNRKITSYQDSLIIFSLSSGLVIYNENLNKVKKKLVTDADGSSLYRVDFVDSRDNIWSGTADGVKMYKSNGTNGRSFYYQSSFPDWFHIVGNYMYEDAAEKKLYLPVFGGEGLYAFDLENETWQTYPIRSNKKGEVLKTDFTSVFSYDGKIRMLGHSGFYDLDEKRGKVVKSTLEFEGLRNRSKGLMASDGFYWTVTINGVYKINLKEQDYVKYIEEIHFCEMLTGETHFLEDERSNIWIGGMCSGFDMYDRERDRFYSFDTSPWTGDGSVTSFSEKDGVLWALTDNGVILQVDITKPEEGFSAVIDLKKQVAEGMITLVNDSDFNEEYFLSGCLDHQGNFWFFNKKGLYCYQPEIQEMELFHADVGIEVNDPSMNVFTANFLKMLSDGRMVYSTRKGICIFHPEQLTNRKEAPLPYITSLSVNNKKIKADSGSYFKINYELAANENFIGIDFSALAFSNPFEIKYNYMLEGVDEEWKDPGDKRFISYTELRGGQYKFYLKAADVTGLWSKHAVEIELNIDKYWYHTSWARGLFLALLIFTIGYIYVNRLRRAVEKEQIKTQYEKELAELKMQALTAQMNPHFIFNSLNSIDYYIIKNDTRKASQYLNRFSKLMRLILKNSRSNYVSLRDDLEALKLYLEIEALRFDHKFEYKIEVDEHIDLDYIKIPPMLVQPYVENAIWHGLLHQRENGKIIVKYAFDQTNEIIKCTIKDNGIGRKKSFELKSNNHQKDNRKSFGMNITKDKIEVINYLHELNAAVEVIDLYDQEDVSAGTMVELNIPV